MNSPLLVDKSCQVHSARQTSAAQHSTIFTNECVQRLKGRDKAVTVRLVGRGRRSQLVLPPGSGTVPAALCKPGSKCDL